MDDYDPYGDDVYETTPEERLNIDDDDNHQGPLFLPSAPISVDYDDPAIASLPRVLLMGPPRGGKTSIQVRKRGGCKCFAGTMC